LEVKRSFRILRLRSVVVTGVDKDRGRVINISPFPVPY
jgi:hypothetical protein